MDSQSSLIVCTNFMNTSLVPWLEKLPPGEGMGQKIVYLWAEVCKKLGNGEELAPQVQAQALAVVIRACSYRLARVAPGIVDDAFLKGFSAIYFHICKAAPPDKTGYALLRNACVNFHLSHLDQIETLGDAVKKVASQGINPSKSEEVDSLVAVLNEFRDSWYLFLRRPEGPVAGTWKELEAVCALEKWDQAFKSLLKHVNAGNEASSVYERLSKFLRTIWLATLQVTSSCLDDLMQSLWRSRVILPYDQEGISQYISQTYDKVCGLDISCYGGTHKNEREELINLLKTLADMSFTDADTRRQALDGVERDLRSMTKRIRVPAGLADELCGWVVPPLNIVEMGTRDEEMAEISLSLRAAFLANFVRVMVLLFACSGKVASAERKGAESSSTAAKGPLTKRTAAERPAALAPYVEEFREMLLASGSNDPKDVRRAMMQITERILAAEGIGHSVIVDDTMPASVNNTLTGEIRACPKGDTKVCLDIKRA